jgi:lipopolysaccharide export system protein LptA
MSVEFWPQAASVSRLFEKGAWGRWLGAAGLAGLLFASAALHAASGAGNAPPGETGTSPRGPLRIQSEQLTADMNANTAEFSGQVRVVDDVYTITADSLTVHFKPQAEGQSRMAGTVSGKDISRMVARGRVVIRSQRLTAVSDAAEYEPDSGQAILWGEKTAPPGSAAPRNHGGAVSSEAGLPAGVALSPGRVRIVVMPSADRR